MPSILHWPEHAEYTVRGGGHQLCLFWGDPPASAIQAILHAPCDLAVAHLGGVLFLMYQFEGGVASSAAAYARGYRRGYARGYSGAARPGGRRRTGTPGTPAPGPTAERAPAEHEVLSVYLVDADTGVLRGARTLPLSAPMAAALGRALCQEEAKPYRGDYAYGREVARALARYPSVKAMLPQALAYSRYEEG
jgi:hypothetical protein